MHPAYFQTHFLQQDQSTDWADQFAIITAHATTGEVWSAEQNTDADARLEAELRSLDLKPYRVTGYSPESGHAEPGWAISISLEEACQFGIHYKQDAIYYILGDQLFVSYCDPARRGVVPVGRFRERLSSLESVSTTVPFERTLGDLPPNLRPNPDPV